MKNQRPKTERRFADLGNSSPWLCGLACWLMIASPSRAGVPAVTALGAYREGLQAPARVAADAAGNLYVTEPQAGQVVVFDAFGRQTKVIPGFARPLAIALDAQGRIYLGEESRGSVSVFDAQWNLLFKLGRGEQEFALPNYLAADPEPDSSVVYVSDSKAHLVKVYRQGVFAFSFGGQGTNAWQLDFPAGVHVRPNGEVLVVDQNNDRIKVFDRRGRFLRAFSLATPLGGMAIGTVGGRSQGIIGDALGRLLVADSFQGFVRIFDAQGNYQGRIGTLGTKPGQFNTPLGLALDGCNRLFTASLNNGRIEVLGLDAFAQLSAVPARQLVGAGTSVRFAATVSDPGACTFQWRKGASMLTDGGQVSGAAGPVLSLANVSPADAGQYSVRISGPGVELVSPAAELGVLLPPVIASISPDQKVMAGSNVTFAVAAAGDALTYQWFFRGQPMVGATEPALTLDKVQPDHAGAYSVAVQNAVGSVASPASQLTVVVPPGQPTIEYTTFRPGAGLQLTVNGEMGYTYWIDGGSNLVDWRVLTNIVNETGSLEVILPMATNAPGQFYRVRWAP